MKFPLIWKLNQSSSHCARVSWISPKNNTWVFFLWFTQCIGHYIICYIWSYICPVECVTYGLAFVTHTCACGGVLVLIWIWLSHIHQSMESKLYQSSCNCAYISWISHKKNTWLLFSLGFTQSILYHIICYIWSWICYMFVHVYPI